MNDVSLTYLSRVVVRIMHGMIKSHQAYSLGLPLVACIRFVRRWLV